MADSLKSGEILGYKFYKSILAVAAKLIAISIPLVAVVYVLELPSCVFGVEFNLWL